MKYYFILTDGKDAWMQFVYLPTGDYVSGYIRDLRSVGISVHDYDLWTKDTRPIAERTLERIQKRMVAGLPFCGWQELPPATFFLLPLHPGIKLGYLVNGC